MVHFKKQEKRRKEDTLGNSLDKVFSIGEDTLGNIWFGTVGSGVWRYDGASLTNFTQEDGIAGNKFGRFTERKREQCGLVARSQANGKAFEKVF